MIEVLSTRKVKAKKDHRCNYCLGKINTCTIYEYSALKTDYFYTWKAHLRCQAIAYKLQMFDYCDDGVTDENFREFIDDEFYKLEGEDNLGVKTFHERLDYVCCEHLKEFVNS